MNLTGKIFIVSILMMGMLFMAFAMALYATHRDWRQLVINDQETPDRPLGLSGQLAKAKARNAELTDQSEKLKQQYDAERAAKLQSLAKLEKELKIARDELSALEARQAELEQAKREAVAAIDAAQASTIRQYKELEGQRRVLGDVYNDREANFKKIVRLTDELNQAANQRDLLKKRTDELAKDLAKAEQVLRKLEH